MRQFEDHSNSYRKFSGMTRPELFEPYSKLRANAAAVSRICKPKEGEGLFLFQEAIESKSRSMETDAVSHV